jgi:hypothetical protein
VGIGRLPLLLQVLLVLPCGVLLLHEDLVLGEKMAGGLNLGLHLLRGARPHRTRVSGAQLVPADTAEPPREATTNRLTMRLIAKGCLALAGGRDCSDSGGSRAA